jgi:hypothetical protein
VKDRLNISAVCQRALREELTIMQAVDTQQDMERIEVDVADGHGGLRTLAFTGRWLVVPDSAETRASEEDGVGYDAGLYWGVALTKRGRIAVYVAHCNHDGGSLFHFDTLDEAADDLPMSIMADARGELSGTVPVMELDI